MNVDLTDAARAMGLRRVPDIEWKPRAIVGDLAVFNVLSGSIRASHEVDRNVDFLGAAERMRASTGRVLTGLDRVRWIIAHELKHAEQLERLGFQGLQDWIRPQYHVDRDIYGVPHHELPVEREADEAAGLVWHLVRINGHRARGAANRKASA